MRNRRLHTVLSILALSLLLAACGANNGEESASNGNGEASGEYPNAFLLVDPDWVEEHKEDEDLVILDARSGGYEEGHIPGAVAFSSREVNDPNNEVQGYLLGEDDFEVKVQELGVNNDSTILVYDDGNALSATRIFYALEYYGLQDQVKVLNGGYAAWLTAGYDISVETPSVEPGDFAAATNVDLISTKEDVESLLDQEDVVFLDTRSTEEYSGEEMRENKHGGHIPGAVHREWTESIEEGEDGITRFLSFEDLKEEYAAIGATEGKTIVPYCQTNVRGAHTYFSLRLLGYDDVRPYEGSWSEWGNADDTEVEV